MINIPKKAVLITWALIIFISPATRTHSEQYPYFSYERFLSAMVALESIPPGSGTQRDLNRFADEFSEGIYDLSSGNLSPALKSLLRARKIWPEYYGPSFLIALIYEKTGDYRTAARYYKEYLDKLRKLEAGDFRISGPLIRQITVTRQDTSLIADELIKLRLEDYGIDLNKVRAPLFIPPLVTYIFFISLAAALYVALRFYILPYKRKLVRLHNPPPGFWICRKCGEANAELVKECGRCGTPRS